MRKQGIIAALLMVAVVTLSACSTSTSSPSSTEVPTPSPTGTATPTGPAEPTMVEPAQPFGGDCAAAMSEDQMTTIFGAGTRVRDGADYDVISTLYVEAGRVSGTLTCSWTSASDSMVATAVMTPLVSLPDSITANPQPAACNGDGRGGPLCTVDVAVGDAWLSLETLTEEQRDQVLATLGESLVSETLHAGTPPEGTWAAPSCDSIVAAAQAAFPEGTVTDGYPSDANPHGRYVEALAAAGSMTYCGLSGLGEEFARVYVFAGIDPSRVDTDLPPTDISGADTVYGKDDGPQVAFVGPNAIATEGTVSAVAARKLIEALISAQTPRDTQQDRS